MALVGLLFVFFILIVAIVLAAFPPERIAQWMTKGSKKKEP
jgi:hypothetical protein